MPSDLLAITSAGAYGLTMSSNYNTRGRAAEVMVDGAAVHLIRQREHPVDLRARVADQVTVVPRRASAASGARGAGLAGALSFQ